MEIWRDHPSPPLTPDDASPTTSLRSTLAKMELALGAIGDAIVWTDGNGSIQWCNRSFDHLINRPHIEILGKKFADLLSLKLQGQAIPAESHPGTVPSNIPLTIRERYEFRQGDRLYTLEITRTNVQFSERVTASVFVIWDITERDRLEKELRQALTWVKLLQEIAIAANESSSPEQAFQTALDVICAFTKWPVGHVYVFADGSAQEWVSSTLWHVDDSVKFEVFQHITQETRLSRVTGLPGRVLEKGKAVWIMDVTQDPHFIRARQAKDIGIKAAFGFPVIVGTEVVAVLEFFSPEASEPDRTLLNIMTQVGTQLGRVIERKRAEEIVKKANDDLSAANKELEAFCYSVSHDLRTPLRSIDGYSKEILRSAGDRLDPQNQKDFARVRAAAARMSQIIDDLLNLSRLSRSPMAKETVLLNVLAEKIFQELKNSRPERKVEFVVVPDLRVEGDSRLLRIALENLFSNAWKFTEKCSLARIEFGTMDDKGKKVFYIKDNGAGFDMAYADKLFGAFQRLHGMEEYPGTGIGLATVQRIIHRHGGKIWAQAKVDEGAVFYFTLP